MFIVMKNLLFLHKLHDKKKGKLNIDMLVTGKLDYVHVLSFLLIITVG